MKTKLNNVEVESEVLSIPYMRQIRIHLAVIGMWPGHRYKILRQSPIALNTMTAILWASILIAKVIHLKNYGSTFSIFDLGQYYITLCMYLLNIQCATCPWRKTYRDCIEEFILHTHLYHFKDKTEYAKKIYRELHTISTFLSYSLVIQMHCGEVFYNAGALYNNYRYGVFTTGHHDLLYSEIPVETNNIYEYLTLFLINYFITYICYFSFCIYSLLICVIVLHIYGHLKILKNSIESIPKPSGNKDKYDKEEEAAIALMIKENIDYHRMIMRFVTQTSTAFGTTVCAYYAFHLYIGCILLFECSTMDIDILRKLSLLTLALVQQLVLISVIFELIGSKSEVLQDAVYSIPWEFMDVSNRKLVQFFLINVQKPMGLKALGMVPVGVRTMASILKTCFSYFLMLRTMAE